MGAIFMGGKPRPLIRKKERVQLSENMKWFDDYFSIEYIDSKTITIGEPRYWQDNFNYLIIGKEKAILFDSGPGERNIKSIIEQLTEVPVIQVVSHFHFDHIGCVDQFEDVYIAENQLIGLQVSDDNYLKINEDIYLGTLEGKKCDGITISRIINDQDPIDIGDRKIEVIYTPGHAVHSISLFDRENNFLFAGDLLMKGWLTSRNDVIKGSNLDEFRKSVNSVLSIINEDTKIFCAHVNDYQNRQLGYEDVRDLAGFLNDSKVREGMLPKIKKVNKNIRFMY